MTTQRVVERTVTTETLVDKPSPSQLGNWDWQALAEAADPHGEAKRQGPPPTIIMGELYKRQMYTAARPVSARSRPQSARSAKQAFGAMQTQMELLQETIDEQSEKLSAVLSMLDRSLQVQADQQNRIQQLQEAVQNNSLGRGHAAILTQSPSFRGRRLGDRSPFGSPSGEVRHATSGTGELVHNLRQLQRRTSEEKWQDGIAKVIDNNRRKSQEEQSPKVPTSRWASKSASQESQSLEQELAAMPNLANMMAQNRRASVEMPSPLQIGQNSVDELEGGIVIEGELDLREADSEAIEGEPDFGEEAGIAVEERQQEDGEEEEEYDGEDPDPRL